MGGDFFQGGGGWFSHIIMRGGGVEIDFCFMRGRHDFVLRHISPINPPPHPFHVIIAESLT